MRSFVRVLGRFPTTAQKLDLVKRRSQLEDRINAFHITAETYLINGVAHATPETPDVEVDDSGYITDDELDRPDPVPLPRAAAALLLTAEVQRLSMPSSIGFVKCMEAGLGDLLEKEQKLREGQANDALQAVRLAIGEKSFHFRKHVHTAKSKVKKTRAWDSVFAVNRRLNHHHWVYNRARTAMIALGAADSVLQRFQLLTKADLAINKAVAKSNAAGQRHVGLAWFWTLDIQGDSADNPFMNECWCNSS